VCTSVPFAFQSNWFVSRAKHRLSGGIANRCYVGVCNPLRSPAPRFTGPHRVEKFDHPLVNVIASRTFECLDIKPDGPGMVRASMVLLWHEGQRGRRIIMTFALRQAEHDFQSSVEAVTGGDGIVSHGRVAAALPTELFRIVAKWDRRRVLEIRWNEASDFKTIAFCSARTGRGRYARRAKQISSKGRWNRNAVRVCSFIP